MYVSLSHTSHTQGEAHKHTLYLHTRIHTHTHTHTQTLSLIIHKHTCTHTYTHKGTHTNAALLTQPNLEDKVELLDKLTTGKQGTALLNL